MENCLISQLKSSVNNDYITQIDELRWIVPAGKTINFMMSVGSNSSAIRLHIVKGTAEFFNNINVSQGQQVTWYKEMAMSVSYKLVTTTETELSMIFSELVNSSYPLEITSLNSISGSIREDLVDRMIMVPTLKRIGFDSNDLLDFDIAKLAESAAPLETLYLNGSKNKGELKSIAKFTGLTTVFLAAAWQGTLKGIYGSVEDFANAQVAAGRTSGTCVVTGNGTVTYNGTAIASGSTKTITYSNGSYTVA